MMDSIEQAESAFASLGGEYQLRKRLSENGVREWRWATWCWFDLRPLYFERNGFAPGRRLRQAPANRYGRVYCGLDEIGRVIVERRFNEFGFYETFYNWANDPIEVSHFDYDPTKKPINLMMIRMVGSHVTSSSAAGISGHVHEDYQWDGNQVRQVVVSYARREQGCLENVRHWHTAKATYDDKGVIQRVELHWPPAPPKQPEEIVEVMFERRGNNTYRRRP